MSAAENRALILEYLGSVSGKKKTPEIVDRFVSDSDALLKHHIAVFDLAFPCYEFVPQDVIAEGDRVVVNFRLRATHGGEYMGIAPTGNQIDVDGIIIYRIVDCKIAEHWIQLDAVTMMRQLGVRM